MTAGLIPFAGAEPKPKPKPTPKPPRPRASPASRRAPRWAPDQVARILQLVDSDLTARECADQFGCSRAAILGLVHRARLKATAAQRPIASGALRSIVAHVAEVFAVTTEDILSDRKDLRVSEPRKVAIYLCRKRTGATTGQLMRFFGRSPSTIFVAIRDTEARLEAPVIRETIERIELGLPVSQPSNNLRKETCS